MLTEKQKEIINFDYQKIPLYGKPFTDKVIPVTEELVDPELMAIWKPSDKKILGVMPQGQYILGHLEAHQRVEDAIKKAGLDAHVSQHRVLRNGARVFTHYRLPTYKLDIENPQIGTADSKEPDTMIPEIIARNGYDGQIVFGLEWGLFRTVCSNGARALVIGKRSTPKNLMGDVDVDVIVGDITEFLQMLQKEIFARIQAMVTNKAENLPVDMRVWFSQQVSDKLLAVYDSKVNEALAQWKAISEWTLFNIFTNIITHHITSYNRQRHLEQVVAKKFKFGATAR